jgi:NTE family protein
MPGDTVSRDVVREAMRRVYGINGFKNVVYQMETTDSNHVNMKVEMREKLPTTLFASLHIDNVFATGLVLNLTARDLLLRESRAVFVADISSNPKFRFDYYKYAGPKKSFAVNLRYDYISREIPLYSEGEVSDIIVNRQQELAFNLISTQSLKQSFLLGGFYQRRKDKTDFGTSIPDEIGSVVAEGLGLQFGYNRNSLNDRNFPTRGSELVFLSRLFLNSQYEIDFREGVEGINLELEGADTTVFIPKEDFNEALRESEPDAYATVFLDYRKFEHFNPRNQLISSIRLGGIVATEDRNKIFNAFRLGGHQRVRIDDARAYGYNYTEIEPENFGVLGLSTSTYSLATCSYGRGEM